MGNVREVRREEFDRLVAKVNALGEVIWRLLRADDQPRPTPLTIDEKPDRRYSE